MPTNQTDSPRTFARSITFLLSVILCLLWLAVGAARRQSSVIGIIDFYGAKQVSEQSLRQALQIQEGDAVPDETRRSAIRHRIEAVAGVVGTHLNAVCCDAGKTILFVGIEERGTHVLRFRPAPHGRVQLPAEVVQAGEQFEKALMEAVQTGDAAEDDTHGHAFSHNPTMRAVEERFLTFAAADLDRLRDVLRHSVDPSQRALAAEILGYAPDKRAVVGDLAYGVTDPDDGVRNNSTRALAVIATYAGRNPQAGIKISPRPFVDLLNSPVWTDRNKGAFALFQLSEQRDPALLAELRRRALPSLIEMARWKSRGHAGAPFFILGRVAGLKEEEIRAAWDRHDTASVVAAALPQSVQH